MDIIFVLAVIAALVFPDPEKINGEEMMNMGSNFMDNITFQTGNWN